MSEKEKITRVNARFYQAMSALDIGEMNAVWLDSEDAICIHPGREAIFGYHNIRESWEMIFNATESLSVTASEERLVIGSELAWVVCTETISMMIEDGLAAASAQATNIFRRLKNDEWRMIVHHASAIPFKPHEEQLETIN